MQETRKLARRDLVRAKFGTGRAGRRKVPLGVVAAISLEQSLAIPWGDCTIFSMETRGWKPSPRLRRCRASTPSL